VAKQASGPHWAGDQRCRPDADRRAAVREELAEAIGWLAAAGQKVKVTGSGHSFTEAA